MSENSLKVISTTTADHYTWGAQCNAWFFLKDPGIQVLQEKMPPGTGEVMHHHRKAKQLFYVLRGELTMRTESGFVKIPAGHAVVVEPQAAHQTRNETGEALEFLVISCPPSHGDRFNCE